MIIAFYSISAWIIVIYDLVGTVAVGVKYINWNTIPIVEVVDIVRLGVGSWILLV